MTAQRDGGFPEGFLWGAATSSYQIEGAVDTDGRGPSIWDTFAATPGRVAHGDTGAVAADHYHRYPEDIELLSRLGARMYRFSVAWPRIQPTGRGPVDQRGLDFYRRLVDTLLEHDIVPNLTLYHWDLPQALQDAGGWPERETALRFAEYAEIMYRALHDRVPWWSTINEPWCVALLGYAAGIHAPGIRDPRQAVRTIHHVLLGHGLALGAMRAIDPAPRQGIVLNLAPVRAADEVPDEALARAVRLSDGYRNRVWLEPLMRRHYPVDMEELVERYGGFPIEPGDLTAIGGPLDWMGINYYNDTILESEPAAVATVHPGVDGVREQAAEGEWTDMRWPITPDGLRELLVRLRARYPDLPPILITENGAAYDDPPSADGGIDDDRRIAYLRRHLQAVQAAIAEGADVRGYLVWSLLDNFEWAEGYGQRFGIVHVDYGTLTRTPRRSAHWFRDVITRNGLPEPEGNAA
ncbi:MAG: beta-glucosidase [Chloroflexi bacterium]|nr:beta-glucosidase [Chloroflexota bacterium]